MMQNTNKVVTKFWTREFQKAWDKCSDLLCKFERIIDWTAPEIDRIDFGAYLAGPKTPKLEEGDIDMMICINMIEPYR